MRNEFIRHLINLAERDESICLLVGDLGYGVVENFEKKFPDRFYNLGVAEQNMIGVASGLASEGFHVFVYSIANFPIFRCAEQIRNDFCYHNQNVTIVSVGGGLSYGNLGYSHHAVQDYSFMRVLPNMKIFSPGDPNEVKICLDFLCKNKSPSYLRLGKTGEKRISGPNEIESPGQLREIYNSNSSTTAIITTGTTIQDIIEFKKSKKILENVDIFTCPIWGIDSKLEFEKLSHYKKIITVEDHLEHGGFGSWILEKMPINQRNKLRIIGLSSKITGMVGSQKVLNSAGGININRINSEIGDK